jgi:hypothetical protein
MGNFALTRLYKQEKKRMKGFISAVLLGCCVCCGGCAEEKTDESTVEIPVEGYEELTYYIVAPNIDPDGEIRSYIQQFMKNDGVITEEEFTTIKNVRREILRTNLQDIIK